MDLINETGLDALCFEMMDQGQDLFEVVAVKVGYDLGPAGELLPMADPMPLATEDEAFGELNKASLRWESDLAPYKPRCDVLVNATAFAPKGPARRFGARLRLVRPERPAGDQKPWGSPPKGQREGRQRGERIPAEVLIDKSLKITGKRFLRKKWLPFRLLWGIVRLVSLGLIRRNPWKLTRPDRVEQVAVRYESAWGGQNCVLSMDKIAKRVKRKHWLPGASLPQLRQAALSGAPDEPIAHSSHPGNPLGVGFAHLWYLKAAKLKRLVAPQVERAGVPFTAAAFFRHARGKKAAALAPEGLGAVSRAWSPRPGRAGTPDYPETFEEDEFPGLADDFDFRYWNCAPDDQQVPYLEGGEILELTNLCSPDHSAATRDRQGNVLLRIGIPRDRPFLVVKDEKGRFGARLLDLDTVIVEPESRVLLTYRAVIPREAGLLWAVLRIQKPEEEDRLSPMLAWMEREAACG